jgi:hypothetical protein
MELCRPGGIAVSSGELRGKWITLLGTGSIQDYVFRTNRLKENAGASELVRQALHEWDKHPSKIFVGGGNAALLFDDKTEMQKAIRGWSGRLLKAAPNLRPLAVHTEIGDSFRVAYRQALRAMKTHADAPPFGSELGQWPVVRECGSTGRAANVAAANGAWISDESKCKQDAGDRSRDALGRRYANALDKQFQFPKEFSDLGTAEGASQIAIVHVDGNRIGLLFKSLLEDSPYDGRELVDRLASLSEAVTQLASEAFAATLSDLVAATSAFHEEGIHYSLADGEKAPYLPVRPIVEAGDDLTFVCHGRLGLSLAVRYLRHFERLSNGILAPYVEAGESPHRTGAAGVLIMPEKFPFARGYDLAAGLTRQAKQARKDAMDAGESDCSWLAFHIILEGATSGVPEGNVYRIGGPEGAHNWSRFEDLWGRFRSEDWPRSRAKRLFEALSRGAPDLELAYLRAAGIPMPPVDVKQREYLAPLEALDFHVPWPVGRGQ